MKELLFKMWARSPEQTKRNKSSRRNKFEIWAEILEVCLRTARTQSWLLRELRLKTSSIREAIIFLVDRELIIQIDESNYNTIGYLTTAKGKETLAQYYKLITKYFSLKKKKK